MVRIKWYKMDQFFFSLCWLKGNKAIYVVHETLKKKNRIFLTSKTSVVELALRFPTVECSGLLSILVSNDLIHHSDSINQYLTWEGKRWKLVFCKTRTLKAFWFIFFNKDAVGNLIGTAPFYKMPAKSFSFRRVCCKRLITDEHLRERKTCIDEIETVQTFLYTSVTTQRVWTPVVK